MKYVLETHLAISTLILLELEGSETRSLWAANWAARPTIVRKLELNWNDWLTRDLSGYVLFRC